MSRILIIDLTDKSIKEEAVPTGRYGRGLAMELIRRHSKEGCERLSPDNTFVVVPGLLTGCHVPCATRATVAARSDNGFAVTSITGDMPQKLASLGISGLVIKGRYECGRCAVYMDGDAVRIFPVPGMDGLTCGDIVENIRKKYGSDCAVIGTGPAGDMRLPLSGLFTTYPEGTPRFTCPRSSFGDVPGSKNLRAVIVKCNKYFGAECADEERLIRDGKALARLIIDDPICGGALPGLGSITILHLLKNKNAIPELPKGKKPCRPEKAGRLNYCCAPGCVIGCLNRHSAGNGHMFSAPEEAEVRAAMAHCFGELSEEELDRTALALSKRGMSLGLNATEFVYTAAMYIELAKLPKTSETLLSLIEETARGSVPGRLIGGGTAALGRLYPDREDIQRRVTRPANTKDSERRMSLHKLCPELGDIGDLELLYRQIFIMENLGLCIFSSFALINRPEGMELMARLYSCRTGETVTPVQLLEYAGECLAAEADMAKDSAAASVRRSIPEFVKVLYRYFGEE